MTIRRTTSRLAAAVMSCAAAAAGAAPGDTGDRVRVGAFAIDRTEVTIAQFRAFARATDVQTAAEKEGGGFEWGSGWERRPGWSVYRPFGRDPASDDEPAVHVTFDEAQAFCRWRGGRLPNSAEWTAAAYTESRADPTDGFERGRTYRYAVGDRPDGMNTRAADAWPQHAAVGSTRRGVNGLFDMGGNVWEWLADRRAGDALTAGGSWWYGPAETTADAMQWKPASFYAVYVGFRCAYDAQ